MNYVLLFIVILCAIMIPLVAYAVNEKHESDQKVWAEFKESQRIDGEKLVAEREAFKQLSCDEMREKIFNSQVSWSFKDEAKELYKWKPCNDVVNP